MWDFEVVDQNGKVMEMEVDSETGDLILVEEQKGEEKLYPERKGKNIDHGKDHKCARKKCAMGV